MITTRSIVTAGLTAGIATTLGIGLVLAPNATASSSGSGARSSGTCSATGSWHLSAKHDNGRIEVEAEVDVNRAGRTFGWTIADGGVVRRGSATTHAPSGSFSIRRSIADKAGVDHVVFRAARAGNVCRGAVDV